jgi:hypothetical protein
MKYLIDIHADSIFRLLLTKDVITFTVSDTQTGLS